MKKLLVLAGSPLQVPLIKTAKDMDLYVISMDNVPNNPGHKFSDRYVNISTTDIDKVTKYSEKNRIDGIITCGSDVAVPTIGYICDKMKINGVSYKQALTLTRKDLFRNFQKKNGLSYPEFFVFSEYSKFSKRIKNLAGKYIIKPADSSGSKAVRVVNLPVLRDDTEMKNIFHNAILFSKVKKAVLEKFLLGLEYGGDAFFTGGKIVSFFATNKFRTDAPYFVPVGHIVPTELSIAIQTKIKKQINRVAKILNLKAGPVNFDVMVTGGEITIIEMSPRLGGNCIPQIIYHSSGFDEIKASINLALGMKTKFNKAGYKKTVFSGVRIIRSSRSGILKRITPREIILKKYGRNLKELVYDYIPGAKVEKFTQGNYRIGHFIANAENIDKLEPLMRKIEKDIKIEIEE